MNLPQYHNDQSVLIPDDGGLESSGRKSLPFEIAPKETETYLTWEEAMCYCQFINYNGGGWRLPSKEELNLMYENKTDEMDYDEGWYWSSTEYFGDSAWIQYFSDGLQNSIFKSYGFFVRAIRNL